MTWEKLRLGDICAVYGGTTPSTVISKYWNGDFLWLSPTDLPEVGEITVVTDSARKISEIAIQESSLSVIPVGGIIYSTRASIGKIGIAGKPLTTNQGFTNLVCGERVFNRFLAYALRTFTPQIAKLGNSTTFPEVSRTAIKNFQIPLPPLPVQRAIADRLDRADALRQKDRQLLQAYDDLAQSVFVEMFGDPVKNEKGWEISELGQHVTIIGGGTPRRDTEKYFKGTICWATSKDIKTDYLIDTQEHITQEAIENSSTKLVPAGTILLVVKSKILAHSLPISISKVPVCFGQDVKGIITKMTLNPYFLATLLKIDRHQLLVQARGVNTEGLTLEHLNTFSMICPPLPLQTQFATILANIEQQKDLVRQQQAESEALFGRLLQEAFEG